MRHLPSASRLLLPCLCAVLPWALADAAAAQQPAADEAALARYKDCIGRKPFDYHTRGREQLAQTRSLEALRLLADDYAKTKDYPEYARYTIASLIGRHFDKGESVDVLAALRAANGRPVDTWLWVQTLRIETDRVGDAQALAIARDDKNALHRAAAIAALGESRAGNLKAAVLATCIDFPKKESERNVLLGAMTGALYAQKRRVDDADYREALTAYIGLLAPEVGLSHTAKVQMARHLQWILKGPALFVNPEPWLEILQRHEVKKPTQGGTSASPRFFGIETDGERLVYVVDMSDSMCKEISPSARPPAAAVTGPRQKKKSALLDESDLPWHKIKTRWDLAREQLRISLLRLSPDKHFSVVWFGTDSGTLAACKGMIRATKANVDRVLAELDSIKTGPAEPLKAPDGQLLGKTNLHSGLRRAFGLAGKGFVDEVAYVDGDAMTEGCDTIFLLSDGAPSWDDFAVVDKDYGEDQVVVDTEYKAAAPRTAQIQYHGPYVGDDWLVEDVKRMNAFRRIRLHCVGLGEANMQLLTRLAEIGHGEVFVVGQRKAEGADKGGPSLK